MKTRLPKLCRNKTRDAAFVYRDGKKIYLGRWNAPETVAAYRRYIADLAADRVPVVAQDASARSSVTVAELTAAFFEDRAEYYVKNGKQTGQLDRFRAALEFPLRYFPATPVDDFGQAICEASYRRGPNFGKRQSRPRTAVEGASSPP